MSLKCCSSRLNYTFSLSCFLHRLLNRYLTTPTLNVRSFIFRWLWNIIDSHSEWGITRKFLIMVSNENLSTVRYVLNVVSTVLLGVPSVSHLQLRVIIPSLNYKLLLGVVFDRSHRSYDQNNNLIFWKDCVYCAWRYLVKSNKQIVCNWNFSKNQCINRVCLKKSDFELRI